jgi:GNAT superfamily N-acetyltransferase
VRMWLSADRVVAATMFTGADTLWFEVLPDAEDLVPQIVGRAERSRLRTAEGGAPLALSIRAFEGDTRRIAAFEALGYTRGEPEGVWFRLDLSKPLPQLSWPDGFRLRDCTDVDPARRAAAHRDAWNDLSEIGIPNAKSTFTTDVYIALKNAPAYDPSLDLLVENEAGEFVANCICWADDASGMAVFEPTGTHPAYRRRGLMRLAMLEALRRVQQRGLKWAGVGTAHFNTPAIAAYGSLFAPLDRTRWWTKTLRR